MRSNQNLFIFHSHVKVISCKPKLEGWVPWVAVGYSMCAPCQLHSHSSTSQWPMPGQTEAPPASSPTHPCRMHALWAIPQLDLCEPGIFHPWYWWPPISAVWHLAFVESWLRAAKLGPLCRLWKSPFIAQSGLVYYPGPVGSLKILLHFFFADSSIISYFSSTMFNFWWVPWFPPLDTYMLGWM